MTSLLATAAIVLAPGCARSLDVEAVRSSIQPRLEELLGAPFATVSCPEREVRAGDVFECTATGRHGGVLTIEVTQVDDQGNVDWHVTRSEGFLKVDAVRRSIQDHVRDQLGVEVATDCGWITVLEAVAGESFECLATDPDGVAHRILVTMTDAAGNVSWQVVEP